jgi:hypothetical protein
LIGFKMIELPVRLALLIAWSVAGTAYAHPGVRIRGCGDQIVSVVEGA